jgi:hypothetical protein
MRQIESAALEDQVIDWVVERAHVTERPMSFAELTGFGRSGVASDQPHGEAFATSGNEQQEANST